MPGRSTCLLLVGPVLLWAFSFRDPGGTLTASTQEKTAPPFSTAGTRFLQKHCLACHGDKVKRADLTLHTFQDDRSVLAQRKLWEKVVAAVKSGEMPPRPKPRPSSSEIDTFLATVQGVFEHADRNARPDPGRVTVRRLNRAEYTNTIRDLVGVDFDPAADFPPMTSATASITSATC